MKKPDREPSLVVLSSPDIVTGNRSLSHTLLRENTWLGECSLDYEEALSWIHSIGRFGMNLGLARIEKLLRELGNPHEKLKFLHIGGTNGKGSTASFAASILESSGYRVGLYTSPYLEQFTNRMSINGVDISRERLVELVNRVKPLVETIAANPDYGQPTEFEVVTALALAYLLWNLLISILEVDWGRLDASSHCYCYFDHKSGTYTGVGYGSRYCP